MAARRRRSGNTRYHAGRRCIREVVQCGRKILIWGNVIGCKIEYENHDPVAAFVNFLAERANSLKQAAIFMNFYLGFF